MDGISTMKHIFLSLIVLFLYNGIKPATARVSNINHIHVGELDSGCFGNLCNEAENYPHEAIKAAIEKHPQYKLFFGTVLCVPHQSQRSKRDIKMTEEDICQIKVGKLSPKIGINMKGNIDTIINTDDLKQEVSYAFCLNQQCQVKYKLVELFTLGIDGKFSKGRFSVPYSCYMPKNNTS